MPRHLFDSEYLFGIHEPGGEAHMLEKGRPGWIVFTEALGSDPNAKTGRDYRQWSEQGLGVIVRLNNGYHPGGTIPNPARYDDFATRCANFVANSQGCKLWIIGNEPNFAIERPPRTGASQASRPAAAQPPPGDPAAAAAPQPAPRRAQPVAFPPAKSSPPPPARTAPAGAAGGSWLKWFKRHLPALPLRVGTPTGDPRRHGLPERFNVINLPESATPLPLPPNVGGAPADAQSLSIGEGEPITPEMYVRCYKLCRSKIQAVQGHGTDKVLVAAVAPWNNQTRYIGNENGDWVRYFRDILVLLGPAGCDGFTLHTYTHGQDANLVTSDARMNAPFQNRYFHFRAYQDFLRTVPTNMRHLPVYITETDQDAEWLDRNIAWVQRAYGEINWWNRQTGNQQIHALVLYRWPRIDKWYIEGKQGVIEDFRQAMTEAYKWQRVTAPPLPIKSGDSVRVKDWLNLRETPAGKVLGQVPAKSVCKVVNVAPTLREGVYWWAVEAPVNGGSTVKGWLAQESSQGLTLLERVPGTAVTPPTTPTPPPVQPAMPAGDPNIKVGGRARTLDLVRMRRTPGLSNKPDGDVLADVAAGVDLEVVAGPRTVDGVTWWQVKGKPGGTEITGWMAAVAPNGVRLLEAVGTQPGEQEGKPQAPSFAVGDRVVTINFVRFRKTPGTVGKPADDTIAELPPQISGVVRGGPRSLDGMTWWQLEMPIDGTPRTGWAAEFTPEGVKLLGRPTNVTQPTPPTTPTPPTQPAEPAPKPQPPVAIATGSLAVTKTAVNVRRTPGMLGKPADDLLGHFENKTTLNVVDGPTEADGVRWWRVGGITLSRGEVIGWVAERLQDGTLLLGAPDKLPGTDIPNRSEGRHLHAPFLGSFGISQLWGENPQIYSRFTYDGVTLKGHNGIDFLTPTGTPLAACDDGTVADAVLNDPGGFGNYIKLVHAWGESIYAHMEAIHVPKGKQVRKGEVIGTADNTGFSGGPHLHFALRVNPYVRTDGWGGFTDPLPYMNPNDVNLPRYVQLPREGTVDTSQSPEALPHTLAPGMGPEVPGSKRP